jgi:DNA-binding transcriptional regulator YiaG
VRLLSRELAELRPDIHVEADAGLQARWVEESWPKKLKAARQNRGQRQKEAADCCGVPLDTYRKWEEGRRPHARNVPAILRYVSGAPRSLHPALSPTARDLA